MTTLNELSKPHVGWWLRGWGMGLTVLVCAGCNEMPVRTAGRGVGWVSPDAGQIAHHAPATSKLAQDAAASSRFKTWRTEDSCARNWSLGTDNELAASLARASETCCAGLSQLRETPFDVSLEVGRAIQVPLSVTAPSACLRVLAVSTADGFEVSLWKGTDLLAGVSSARHIAAAPPDGLICVLGPADLRLELARTATARAQERTSAPVRAVGNIWIANGE